MNARWISHLLADDQKRSRVAKAKIAFDNLVTGDLTLIYFWNESDSVATEFWPLKCNMPQYIVLPKEYAR